MKSIMYIALAFVLFHPAVRAQQVEQEPDENQIAGVSQPTSGNQDGGENRREREDEEEGQGDEDDPIARLREILATPDDERRPNRDQCRVASAAREVQKTDTDEITQLSALYQEANLVPENGDEDVDLTALYREANLQYDKCQNWQFRVLDPKIRVYFDAGRDADERIDLFRDGSLSAAVDFFGFVKPFSINRNGWTNNFSFGFGIGGQATTSMDGMSIASNAPIVVISAAYSLEIPIWTDDNTQESYVGIEIGRSYGRTSDENFNGSSAEDHAWYVGITLKIPPK